MRSDFYLQQLLHSLSYKKGSKREDTLSSIPKVFRHSSTGINLLATKDNISNISVDDFDYKEVESLTGPSSLSDLTPKEYNMAWLTPDDSYCRQIFEYKNTFKLSSSSYDTEGRYPEEENKGIFANYYSKTEDENKGIFFKKTKGPAVLIQNAFSSKEENCLSGLGVGGEIVSDRVYNGVWNDLADCIQVQEDLELIPGKCYSFDGENFYLSSKYLDENFIGIHSDTAGFYLGFTESKSLQVGVKGFTLAYVDKEYKPGTPLTCTEKGYLTEIKKEDIERNPHRIIGTFWKKEWSSWIGFKKAKLMKKPIDPTGRMWIKLI